MFRFRGRSRRLPRSSIAVGFRVCQGPPLPRPRRRFGRRRRSAFLVDLRSGGAEFLALGLEAGLDRLAFVDAVVGGPVADLLGDLHTAELGPAHAAEVGGFEAGLGQRLVVVFLSQLGVERQVEMVLPAELEPGLAQDVIAVPGARVTLGQVGGMGGDLVGDDAVPHVLLVGQAEVFLGRDVAEQRWCRTSRSWRRRSRW